MFTRRGKQNPCGFWWWRKTLWWYCKRLCGRRPPYNTEIHLLGKNVNHPKVEALKKIHCIWNQCKREEGSLDLSYEEFKDLFSRRDRCHDNDPRARKCEAFAEGIKDVVLTVRPSTHKVSQAYLDAAEIAGLKVLSLIEENTAAALQYGLDRIFKDEKSHKMLVYNMGAIYKCRYSVWPLLGKEGRQKRDLWSVHRNWKRLGRNPWWRRMGIATSRIHGWWIQ